MDFPGVRCSAREILPVLESRVQAFEEIRAEEAKQEDEERTEEAARQVRLREAQRAARNDETAAEAALTLVDLAVADRSRKRGSERRGGSSAKRIKMNSQEPRNPRLVGASPQRYLDELVVESPPRNTEQNWAEGIYEQRFKQMLDADGRGFDWFVQVRNATSQQERDRLIDVSAQFP